jgi:hypothetical protein
VRNSITYSPSSCLNGRLMMNMRHVRLISYITNNNIIPGDIRNLPSILRNFIERTRVFIN